MDFSGTYYFHKYIKIIFKIKLWLSSVDKSEQENVCMKGNTLHSVTDVLMPLPGLNRSATALVPCSNASQCWSVTDVGIANQGSIF